MSLALRKRSLEASFARQVAGELLQADQSADQFRRGVGQAVDSLCEQLGVDKRLAGTFQVDELLPLLHRLGRRAEQNDGPQTAEAQRATTQVEELREDMARLAEVIGQGQATRRAYADLLKGLKEKRAQLESLRAAKDVLARFDRQEQLIVGRFANCFNSLPDEVRANPEGVKTRLERLSMDSEARLKAADEAEEQALGEAEERGKAIADILQPLCSKRLDRMRWGDRTVVLTRAEETALKGHFDKSLALALKFMDAAECTAANARRLDAMLAHIPEFVRPPTLDRREVAWRRTWRDIRRNALRERIDEVEQNEGPIALLTEAYGVLAANARSLGQSLHVVERGSRNEQEALAALAALQEPAGDGAKLKLGGSTADSILELNAKVITGLNVGKGIALKGTETLSGLEQSFGAASSKFGQAMKRLGERSRVRNELLKEGNVWFGPCLELAAAVLALAQAIKSIFEHVQLAGRTEELQTQARVRRTTETDDNLIDGRALELALGNEIAQRFSLIDQETVHAAAAGTRAVGASLQVASAAAMGTDLGTGYVAGKVVTWTGKGIGYGGAVVFKHLDNKRITRARLTLNRAQAGDPIARERIFCESGLFAKMYIAILAQDGDPLAVTYIHDRGITEADLSDNTAATRMVLGKLLMRHSEQTSEFEEYASEDDEGLKERAIAWLSGELKGALSASFAPYESLSGKEKLLTLLSSENAGATALRLAASLRPDVTRAMLKIPAQPTLSASEWSSILSRAHRRGTIVVKRTGVTAALKQLEDFDEKSGLDLDGEQTDPEQRKSALGRAVRLQGVEARIRAWDPVSVQNHRPACLITYQKQMLDLATEEKSRTWAFLGRGEANEEAAPMWSPEDGAVGAALSLDRWKTNWRSLTGMYGPLSDQGMGKAIEAVDASQRNAKKDRGNPAANRKGWLKARRALSDLARTNVQLQDQIGWMDGVRTYLTDLQKAGAKLALSLDDRLFSAGFDASVEDESGVVAGESPDENTKLTSQHWTKVYAKAVQAGQADNKKTLLGQTLRAHEKLAAAANPDRPDLDSVDALSRVVAAAEAFSAGEAHPVLLRLAASFKDQASGRIREIQMQVKSLELSPQDVSDESAAGLSKAFKETFAAAVNVGVFREKDARGAHKQVVKALGKFARANEAFGERREPGEKRRKAFLLADAAGSRATAAVVALSSRPMLLAHAEFRAFTLQLQARLAALVGKQAGDSLGAWNLTFQPDGSLKRSYWQTVKAELISGGHLTKKEAQKKLGKALDRYGKYRTALLDPNKNNAKDRKRFIDALRSIRLIVSQLQALVLNKEAKAFLGEIAAQATATAPPAVADLLEGGSATAG